MAQDKPETTTHRLLVPQVIDGKEYGVGDEIELTQEQAMQYRAAGVVTSDASPEAREGLASMGGTSNQGGPPETGYDRMAKDGVPADEKKSGSKSSAKDGNSASSGSSGVSAPKDGKNS